MAHGETTNLVRQLLSSEPQKEWTFHEVRDILGIKNASGILATLCLRNEVKKTKVVRNGTGKLAYYQATDTIGRGKKLENGFSDFALKRVSFAPTSTVSVKTEELIKAFLMMNMGDWVHVTRVSRFAEVNNRTAIVILEKMVKDGSVERSSGNCNISLVRWKKSMKGILGVRVHKEIM